MASLKEFARETSLAEATVSRILRQQDQCTPETRRRVIEVARRLKYRPNMLVRGMQTGRTNTIGVMLPLASEFFGDIFQGVHEALVQADHVPIVLWCYDELAGNTAEPSELKQIYRLLDRRVDGVILRPVDDAIDDSYLRAVWEQRIPLVAVDRQLEHTHADFVGIDDAALGRAAAHQLLSLGHRRLGHLAGPDTVTTSRQRRRGFESTAAAAGATCITAVDASFSGDEDPVRALLQRSDRPTAVFAANDVLAVRLYSVARDLGLCIPHDLSVIGCGNLRVSAALYPRLHTFDQNPHETGREAVRLLLQRLADDPDKPMSPQIIHLPFAQVPGQSVAPAHLR